MRRPLALLAVGASLLGIFANSGAAAAPKARLAVATYVLPEHGSDGGLLLWLQVDQGFGVALPSDPILHARLVACADTKCGMLASDDVALTGKDFWADRKGMHLRARLGGVPVTVDWGRKLEEPTTGKLYVLDGVDYRAAVTGYSEQKYLASGHVAGSRKTCTDTLSRIVTGDQGLAMSTVGSDTVPFDEVRDRLLRTRGNCPF